MSHYDDRPEDLKVDTQNFITSDYGNYVMSTLEDMKQGILSNLTDMDAQYPGRYGAKYAMAQEIINFIKEPLDDDTPSRGE